MNNNCGFCERYLLLLDHSLALYARHLLDKTAILLALENFLFKSNIKFSFITCYTEFKLFWYSILFITYKRSYLTL